MKAKYLASSMAVSVALVVSTGCQKQESVSTEKSQTTESKPANGASELQQTADNAAAATTQEAQAMSAKAQSLIDQAKSLVSQNKYQDAVDTLKKLSDFKLTPEQQKTVDNLKAEIQKLMTNPSVSNAVNAAGGLFK